MKINIIFVLSLLFWLASCKSPNGGQQNILSVTIEPQRYFLEQLVGDKYIVNCVVPTGANPESFDLSPTQLMSVNKSLIYFKVGFLGIENTWIKNIGETNPDIRFIDSSIGIPLIEEGHADCGHEEEHHSHGGEHAGGVDPHTWSSPATARIMVKNMFDAVVKSDSVNKDFYTANYNKLITEINHTDSIIKTYIDNAACKSFIIYHPALSYFAQEYRLEQLTVENDGKSPSPSYMKDLIDKAKEEGVKAVFIQQEFDPKNTETVAAALNVKPVSVNLLSYNWSEEMIKIARVIAGKHE